MRDEFWSSVEVRFIDLDQVLRDFEQLRTDPSSLVAQEFPVMAEL